IYVIEEHDIVVVFTSDNEDGPYEYDELVGNIVGAVTNEYPEDLPFVMVPLETLILTGVVTIAVVAVIVRLKR
ncbi:MAG: hypothetical protein RTS72_03370, partial [Candidatus Thorarchaeota archaeon]